MLMGESRRPCRTTNLVQKQSPLLSLKQTPLVALNQIRLALMVFFFIIAHKAECQTPVEGHFEVYEDMVSLLLVLEIFLTKESKVEDLLNGGPSCS